MNTIDAQDKALQDAMARMDAAPTSGGTYAARPTRQTRLTPETPTAPSVAGLYRVRTMDGTEIDAMGTDYGTAVLRAIDIAKAERIAHYGAMIFMWQYDVTDSTGETRRGMQVEPELGKARIARQNARQSR